MPTIASILHRHFQRAILAATGIDADPLISPSQNEKFGDYQANAAMSMAKALADKTGQKSNPRALAEQIVAKLELGNIAAEVSIAGPGFINVRLSPVWLADQLMRAAEDPRLGVDATATPLTVVVDYSGPNIAKEMHVAHLRGTIIGDCLARLLEFAGHRVIRQNHIGDWGLQMGMVTFALEREGAAAATLGLNDLSRLYKEISAASKDPVMRRQMAERTCILQNTPKAELSGWRRVRDLTLCEAHDLYQQMDVSLTQADVRGESDYSDEYAPLVNELLSSGAAVETEGAVGVFAPGFVNEEKKPRPFIIRSRDGSYQYPTFDLAALRYRVRALHADWIIYSHDQRQADHFAYLFAVARQFGIAPPDRVKLEFAPFGTILGEDGKPYKSRSGEVPRLKDLLDEATDKALSVVTGKNPELPADQRQQIAHSIGVGAVKYADLSKDRASDYIFSFDKMLSLEGNTAPYLLYAHARTKAIFRRAQERDIAFDSSKALIVLQAPHELALARHLLRFSEAIEATLRELKPHILCAYLYELANRFSGFFENCPVIQSEEPMRASRLALCQITGRTLAAGLDLLGIGHPDQM